MGGGYSVFLTIICVTLLLNSIRFFVLPQSVCGVFGTEVFSFYRATVDELMFLDVYLEMIKYFITFFLIENKSFFF